MIEQLNSAFPRSIRPKQLQALALARKGDWREAQMVLGELYVLGHRDPETLGIYARTWRDRFAKTRDPRHLMMARDLYAEAFLTAPQDYYCGINAASISVLLGEFDAARSYAVKTEKIVGNQPIPGDFWSTATAAEVQLIEGNYMEAARLYASAIMMDPASVGSHEAVLRQAERLMASLKPAATERDAILTALGREGR